MTSQVREIQKNVITVMQGDLSSFRNKLNEKIMEDNEFQQKEKEKSRALFNEMVRLGEVTQKQQQISENQNVQYQAKIQQLEF